MTIRAFGDIYRGRRVLVTGHTGFKGSWLVTWLVRLGAQVCGYSNGIPTNPSLFESAELAATLRHEVADIRDLDRLSRVLADFRPDFVFHLAAQAIVSTSYKEPIETFAVNVMGTATVLEALRAVDWPCAAVIITSDKAYDNVEWPWGYREGDRLGGKDIYSGSKGGAELAFYSWFHSFLKGDDRPLRCATARAGNVIGGGDWAADRIVADCIRAWQQDRPVQIRSPQATRPWQHVLEPLSGYLALGKSLFESAGFHGESFNFGPRAEQNATVVQLLSAIGRVWGFEDGKVGFEVTENRPFHEATLLKLCVDKALLALSWQPTLSYGDCVRMTGEWYRDVQKRGQGARAVTQRQIDEYVSFAVEQRLDWTVG